MIWLIACTAEKPPTETAPEIVEATAFAGEDFAVEVGTEVLFDAGASTGAHFEWNFADGQTAQGHTATHHFSETGHHQVVLTSFASDGQRQSDSVLVTVHHPITNPSPSYSSTIAVDSN